MVIVEVAFDKRKVTITASSEVDLEVIREPVTTSTDRVSVDIRGDWDEVVNRSEYAALERDFCLRSEGRGWIVQRSRSEGPHTNDINIYPPDGKPMVRLAAFYAPSGRVAFHNRVSVDDAVGRNGVAAVYDYAGKPNEKFAGLRIRLRTPGDVDAALDLASLVYERIVG